MSRSVALHPFSVAATALMVSQIGCATMALERAPSTSRVISTRQEAEDAGRFVPRVTQDGTLVHVQLDRECQFRTYDRVETTEHWEKVNKNPTTDVAFGATGGALIALGIWGLADAANTYSDNTSSRTYNPVGQGTQQGLSVASLVGGAALAGVAVVDIVRAQGGAHKTSTAERQGDVAGRCAPKPAPGVRVTGAFSVGGTTPVRLGTTDSAGVVDIDLTRLAPPAPYGDINGDPYGATISIVVDEQVVGTASLSSAYVLWRPVWKKAIADREASAAETRRVAAQREAAARIQRDQEALEQFESKLTEAERIFTKLEQKKEPWGKGELVLLLPFINWFQSKPTLSVDDSLAPRAEVIHARLKLLGKRFAPLVPKMERATARVEQERAAEEAAATRQWEAERPLREASERQRAENEARIRAVEERHQRERADDQRRNEQQRADDDRKRQQERDDTDRRRKKQFDDCQNSCTCEAVIRPQFCNFGRKSAAEAAEISHRIRECSERCNAFK